MGDLLNVSESKINKILNQFLLVIFSSTLDVVNENIELFEDAVVEVDETVVILSLRIGIWEEVSWNEKCDILSMIFKVVAVMFIRSHLIKGFNYFD